MTPRRQTKMGFTLLEMLLASALAAVLLSGALSVVGLLSRDRIRQRQVSHRERAVPEVLERDLVNARTIEQAPGSVELIGYGSLKHDDGIARPVRVRYELSRGNLLRREWPLDAEPGAKPWSEIVEFAVEAFVIDPLTKAREAGAPVTLSRAVAVSFRWKDGTTVRTLVDRF